MSSPLESSENGVRASRPRFRVSVDPASASLHPCAAVTAQIHPIPLSHPPRPDGRPPQSSCVAPLAIPSCLYFHHRRSIVILCALRASYRTASNQPSDITIRFVPLSLLSSLSIKQTPLKHSNRYVSHVSFVISTRREYVSEVFLDVWRICSNLFALIVSEENRDSCKRKARA